MAVCEFLHCTKTELEQRLKTGNGFVDYFLILAFIARKAELEQQAVDEAKQGRTGR